MSVFEDISVTIYSNKQFLWQQYFVTETQTYSLTTAPVTKQGELPLAVAVRYGNLDVVKYLVKECNVNVNGES